MSRPADQSLKDAHELLGQFIDLAIKRRMGHFLGQAWICSYCSDIDSTPDKIRHKHNCLVARAKEYMEKHRI